MNRGRYKVGTSGSYELSLYSKQLPTLPKCKMATFSYKLRGNKSEKTVIVRFTHNKEHFERAVEDVKVLAKDFDVATGLVKQRVQNAHTLNTRIERVRARIDEALGRVKKRGLEQNVTNLRAAYTLLMEQVAVLAGDDVSETLNDVEQDLRNAIAKLEMQLAIKQEELSSFLDARNGTSRKLLSTLVGEYATAKHDNPLAEKTKKSYVVLKNVVKQYFPLLLITDVTADTLITLRNKLTEKGMRNSSVNEYVTRLKAAIGFFADEFGIDTRFFKKIKAITVVNDKPVIYLTPNELIDVENLVLTKPRQQHIRDLFLLSAYTGLRHVDLHFTQANISGGYLQFLATKTQRQVEVPFSTRATAIMARMQANGYEYEAQTVGNYSKEVRDICALVPSLNTEVVSSLLPNKSKKIPTAPKYKLISSKVGRKTFINNCLINGVRIEVVAEWVGHSSMEMITNHYANKRAQSEGERYKIEVEQPVMKIVA